jgi:hypothetical protein
MTTNRPAHAADAASTNAGGGLVRTLGFGMYLASSWTWCIGMFLPLLLLRDYGIASFAAFAIPNVAGAAAMGWVLRSREQADGFVRAHRGAARGFSIITILFHVFFVAWLVKSTTWAASMLETPTLAAGLGVGVAAALLLLGWLVSRVPMGWVLVLAALAWVGSLVLGLSLPRPSTEFLNAHAATQPGLLFLAPVMAFGFALCPYLDLTFLRARRSLEVRQSRVAFTIGFGVFFAVMIALTLHYSELILGAKFGAFPLALAAHMVLQAVFTVGVHLRELMRSDDATAAGDAVGASSRSAAAAKFVVAALGLGVASVLAPPQDLRSVVWPPTLMPSCENVYRVFMSFYALVFPAYVLLVVLARPAGTGWTTPPSRALVVRWFIVTTLAAPFFALGVFARAEVWYVPGLVMLAIAFAWTRRGLATRE